MGPSTGNRDYITDLSLSATVHNGCEICCLGPKFLKQEANVRGGIPRQHPILADRKGLQEPVQNEKLPQVEGVHEIYSSKKQIASASLNKQRCRHPFKCHNSVFLRQGHRPVPCACKSRQKAVARCSLQRPRSQPRLTEAEPPETHGVKRFCWAGYRWCPSAGLSRGCTPAAGSTKRGAPRAPAASRRAQPGPCARARSALRAGRGAAGVSAGTASARWHPQAPRTPSFGPGHSLPRCQHPASILYPNPACLCPAPESRIEPRPAQQLLLVFLPRFASWCSAASPLRSQCLWLWREVPLSRSSSCSSPAAASGAWSVRTPTPLPARPRGTSPDFDLAEITYAIELCTGLELRDTVSTV
ncbi:uncharacterized protein LOC129547541 [Moschus berezovskii]|uniref:uncharacterized protein LOC129547541 n=1 Tax=Moschus berezovskii TaxID=68408 RepID=UPI002444C5F2|nr:uncharacterized protein LOC129547541 [Moschus berezovskii]